MPLLKRILVHYKEVSNKSTEQPSIQLSRYQDSNSNLIHYFAIYTLFQPVFVCSTLGRQLTS